MVKATMQPLHQDMPNHPDVSELIKIIAYADPLIVAEGQKDGQQYVMISSPQPGGPTFTFTKTADGYSVVRNQ